MAAVTGYLERSPRETAAEEGRPPRIPGVEAFGRAPDVEVVEMQPPPLEAKHAKQTKMLWHRMLMEQELAKQHITVGVGAAGRWYFFLSPGIATDVVPWAPAKEAGAKPFEQFRVWSWTSKMVCPSFDLPAGAPSGGGTCPAASAGQSVVPDATRRKWAGTLSVKVELEKTICSSCYAGTGQYTQLQGQGGEILRKWWVKSMLTQPEQLATILVESLLAEKFPNTPYLYRGKPLLPVRIHSSGDFFSDAYFDVWVEVAKRVWALGLPVRFWSPTRMWVLPKTRAHMATRLGELARDGIDNLLVRPSAYHFNDTAPAPLHPTNACGSTSIYKDQPLAGRADFACPVYAALAHGAGGEANCGAVAFTPPPGYAAKSRTRSCRVCWMDPAKSVDYTAHFG